MGEQGSGTGWEVSELKEERLIQNIRFFDDKEANDIRKKKKSGKLSAKRSALNIYYTIFFRFVITPLKQEINVSGRWEKNVFFRLEEKGENYRICMVALPAGSQTRSQPPL